MISFENDSFNDSSFDDDRDQSSKPPKTQFFSNGGAIRSLHDSCCAIIAKSMAFESVQEYAETVIQCPLPEHSQMRIGELQKRVLLNCTYVQNCETNDIFSLLFVSLNYKRNKNLFPAWQHRLLQSQRTCK